MGKENVIYKMEYCPFLKNDAHPFATTWKDLKDITVVDTAKNIIYMESFLRIKAQIQRVRQWSIVGVGRGGANERI